MTLKPSHAARMLLPCGSLPGVGGDSAHRLQLRLSHGAPGLQLSREGRP